MAEYIDRERVIEFVKNYPHYDFDSLVEELYELPTADVIEREKVKNLIEVATEDSWDLDYTLDRLKEVNSADVIERSEYDKLLEENKQLKRIISDKVNEDLKCAFEIKELRSKIDKAIEESYKKGLTDAWECARKIGNNSQLGLEEMGFDFSELGTYYNPSWWVVFNYDVFKALEILKRNIEGE